MILKNIEELKKKNFIKIKILNFFMFSFFLFFILYLLNITQEVLMIFQKKKMIRITIGEKMRKK